MTVLREDRSAAMIRAINDNMVECFQFRMRGPHFEIHDDPDLYWYTSDLRYPPFNSVLITNLGNGTERVRIAEVAAYFRDRGRRLWWWVTPLAQPTNLGEYLLASGFVTGANIPGMAMDLLSMPQIKALSPDVMIEQIRNAETLRRAMGVMQLAMGFPDSMAEELSDVTLNPGLGPDQPMQHYIGLLAGKPVSTAALFKGSNGVAGIYNVATIPGVRGKGLGTAITEAALQDAREAGYKVGVLTSSDIGFNVYRQLGFQEYSRYGIYTAK